MCAARVMVAYASGERTNGGTPEFGVPPFVTNDGTGDGEEEGRRRSGSDGVSG